MDNVLSGMVSVVDTHLSFRDAEYDAARHFTEDLERRLEAIDAEVLLTCYTLCLWIAW